MSAMERAIAAVVVDLWRAQRRVGEGRSVVAGTWCELKWGAGATWKEEPSPLTPLPHGEGKEVQTRMM